MKKVLIIIALLATLNYSSSLSTEPFGLNLSKTQGDNFFLWLKTCKKKVTLADLWKYLGKPDTFGIVGDSASGNIFYVKDNITCYLLITDLYSIEIKEGEFENIKIGMKKRKILRKLKNFGKATTEILPTREFLEYKYGGSNYILSLEFKKKRLTRIHIEL